MAEFCYECWSELFGNGESPEELIISKYHTLCEGCAEYKPVVIAHRKHYLRRIILWELRYFIAVLIIVCHLLTLPCRIFLYFRRKNKH